LVVKGGRVEEPGFDAFVASRGDALFRFGCVLAGNPHDGEDLVQEALIRTGVAWSRIQRKDDPEGYVRQTMVRLNINRWRKHRRERLVAAVPETHTEEPGFSRVDSESGLAMTLDGLPPRMRTVLVLRYVEGLSDNEIATVMGCAIGTVKSQASRALVKLRTTIEGVSSGSV
jgi:RNA polymerase sigma-70 factor (sigma-E family)